MIRHGLRLRRGLVASALMLAAFLAVGGATPAAAEISDGCQAEAIFPDGTVVDPGAGDEFTVPRSGEVNWEGSIVTDATELEARAHNGRAEIVLPPLGGAILGLFRDDAEPDVRTWRDDDATTAFDRGRSEYDIPSWVPAGGRVTVEGFHFDPAAPGGMCTGSVVLILDGNPFESPTTIIAIVGVIGSLAGMWWAFRARPGTYDPPRGNPYVGLVAGGLLGGFVAPLLWAFGVIDLSSAAWPALPIVGAIAGLAGGLFPPFDRPTFRPDPGDGDPFDGGPTDGAPPFADEPVHAAPHPAADIGPAGASRTLAELENEAGHD